MRQTLFILMAFSFITVMGQQQEMTSANKTKYLMYLPDMDGPESGFPLMLFLHGIGECGDNLDLVKKNGPPSFLDDKKDFPFIVLSPQCPEGEQWIPELLIELIEEFSAIAFVDTSRIYVTGLGMGGTGTWDLALAKPDMFAAIVPICGKGNPEQACKLKKLPVWVFHGEKDDVIPSSYSSEMVDALEKCGGIVKFTLYQDVDHSAWIPAYDDPALFEWMLEQHR
jgi:predicted peptidase